ncbi:MAG: hypothetical protein JWN93_1121 [Hyphomicrobiales bacterium]|nr:hypothetical protein [Hyphomicrobiales bacterium]
MSFPEFERMLGAVLPSSCQTSLTLTETPATHDMLTRMLEQAILLGERQHTRLTQIHAPRSLFPELGATFGHVPVADSGDAVVRLVFEPHGLAAA